MSTLPISGSAAGLAALAGKTQSLASTSRANEEAGEVPGAPDADEKGANFSTGTSAPSLPGFSQGSSSQLAFNAYSAVSGLGSSVA